MNGQEIIEMAKEAGFAMAWMSHEEHQCIERLVSMAQAAEREACAELAENCDPRANHRGIASAIRARSCN